MPAENFKYYIAVIPPLLQRQRVENSFIISTLPPDPVSNDLNPLVFPINKLLENTYKHTKASFLIKYLKMFDFSKQMFLLTIS